MEGKFKTVNSSRVTISQLMLPSYTNFSGKIHGGYLLSLLDQIAFACASKYSGNYCVTASVDTVNFLAPIEVGELVTLKASVNYVGNSSMIVGIRVEAENIQTGKVKHCNSSYFTMVAKDENGKNTKVPGLIIKNQDEVRRFYNCLKQIATKKEFDKYEEAFDYKSDEALLALKEHNVKVELN
ncbi:acyl-CoA thioesterase [Flavobacterium aquatile]|uniref:Thioesterase n=1 Tax=Flavobacterium aquatile LMG 4008 = ATCC 11947 TaxID=1453498 RepID=A0A095SZ83_9FLAO|nr:acyl-CoA thioesterase [Flavobacterium aquatile]KGD69674.1 thioesterase [Flavobacterium aquatile LMG 4008 = ATCC 11947]OXA67188.1 acyl-CoA thioesterase [Flavobacterium aquatile] [Flavobacterium aquatile LMG 4008 = ATCC 11947]GEC77844.1 acyl-CoA thioesterase [Flavobacterium aquatile]